MSLEGNIEITKKTKTVDGAYEGSPQNFPVMISGGPSGSSQLSAGKRDEVRTPISGASTSSDPNQITDLTGGSGTITAKANNFKVNLAWIGAGTPTKTCWLRIGSSTHADVTDARQGWNISMDTGISSQSSQSVDRSGPNPDYSEDYTTGSGAGGFTVITVNTGGGTSHTENISISPTSTATATARTQNLAKALAGVNLSAGFKDYSLTIGRGGGAKRKGDPGVVIDEDKDEWIDEDGVGHGQSRYSYKETSDFFSLDPYGDVELSQVFVANAGASWSANANGTWSNPHPQDRKHPEDPVASHIEKLPDSGTIYQDTGDEAGWHNTPSSGSDVTVTYTLNEDVSGTTLNAVGTYILKLHDEWENPTDLPETSREGRVIVGGWSSHVGAGTQTYQWTFTEEHEAIIGTTFVANFKAKDWVNIGGKIETSSKFKANVVTGGSVTLKGGEKSQPYMEYTIRTQNKLVDQFTLSGYNPNAARTDGKWPQSGDLPLSIPNDILAAWTEPQPIDDENSGGP